jgi:pyruvate dehydrogenase E2 component (dihydrolipoamide acetyltransferase)
MQQFQQSNANRPCAAFPSHTVVSMPALSPTMTSGNIGTWQKKVGDTIAPGDVLVEIETDKAQMDFEFQEEGVIAKILKGSGEKDVAVGSVSTPEKRVLHTWSVEKPL